MWKLFNILVFHLILQESWASYGNGVLNVKVTQFSNKNNQLITGKCCSTKDTYPFCRSQCRTFFRLCAEHSSRIYFPKRTKLNVMASRFQRHVLAPIDNTIDDSFLKKNKGNAFSVMCTIGAIKTDVVANSSFSGNKDGILLVKFPFSDAWPIGFRIIIEAWHEESADYTNEDARLITRHVERHAITGGSDWDSFSYRLPRNQTLEYSMKVSCEKPFFGRKCSLKCNKSGSLDSNRMNCTDNGEVVCMTGWSGKNCNIAQCQEGCHSKHGYCTQPGECKCALGWRGRNCDECVPLPGCKQGFCNSTSYECICNPGWEGTYCSIPVCREGCHSSRGYCKLPGQCRCRIGWGGSTCELCRPLPGCKNGYCTKPLECKCRPGWVGMHCDIPICKANCSKEHGSCSKPGECRCDVGWWGENCETCFPYPGCKHGSCNKPWECICEEGWKGMKCDQKVEISKSYCYTHPNPCRNGGTCMDADLDPEYKCACNPIFTGENCDFLVNARPFYFPIFPRNSARSFTPVTSLVRAVEAQSPLEYEDDAVEEPEIEQPEGKSLKEAINQPIIEKENILVKKNEEKIENTENAKEIKAEILNENEEPVEDTTIIDEKEMKGTEMTEPTLIENIKTETSSEITVKMEPKYETTTKRQIVVPIKHIKYEISTSSSLSISKPNNAKEEEKNFSKEDIVNISKSLIKVNKEETQSLKKNFKTRMTTEKAILESKQEYGREKLPTKVTIRKKIAPVLFLELRSPTKPFQSPLEDDIENTDANSPQANQISKRARFLRHQESVGVPPFSRRISVPLPLPSSVQPAQQEAPRPARLRISRYSVNSVSPVVWEPVGESSNIKSIVPARLTGSFHQRNINGKGGPMRAKGHFRTNIDPIKDFTSHEDHEAIQASDSFHTTGTVNRIPSNSYHVQNYNGRVHIGDTTEVEKNAPLKEILQAFIELKKIKR